MALEWTLPRALESPRIARARTQEYEHYTIESGRKQIAERFFAGCGNNVFLAVERCAPLNSRTPASRERQPGKAFACRWFAAPSMPPEGDNSSDYSPLRTHRLGSKGMSPAAPHLDSPAFRRLACRLDRCQDARLEGFRQPPSNMLAGTREPGNGKPFCCPQCLGVSDGTAGRFSSRLSGNQSEPFPEGIPDVKR